MKRIILLGMTLLMITFVSFTQAQSNNPQSIYGAEPTTTSFRSTGTLMGSGSQYASTPMLNADGTAAYSGANTLYAHTSSGPRRIAPTTPTGNPTPIGDAALPLLLLAVAYVLVSKVSRLQGTDRK